MRDYSTAAFRFYAKCGSANKYIEKLAADYVKQSGVGLVNPTEGALIRREQVERDHAAELDDLRAAEKALTVLEVCAGRYAVQAVEHVYFRDCWRDLEKGDIESRVHYAEINIPASRAQIYRWLAKARRIFANERGLRV